MTKLFVGGLSYSLNNDALADLFKQFGEVTSAQIITDKFTGQSKGFGFVEMADDAAAQTAISQLDGSMVENRKLGVSVARPREENSRPGGGGGYNRGGNGGGFGGGNGGGGGFQNRGRNGGGNGRSNGGSGFGGGFKRGNR